MSNNKLFTINLRIGLVLTFSFIVFLYVLFKSIGIWLILADPLPEKLDILFTFAGENVRDVYSKELLEKYPDAHWIVSCSYDKNKYEDELYESGFDTSGIFTIDTCTSTFSEVCFLNDYLIQKFTSPLTIGLVSGPYHMKRISIIINKIIQPNNIKFRYLPVPQQYYSIQFDHHYFENWWKESLLRSEVLKIINDIVKSWRYVK